MALARPGAAAPVLAHPDTRELHITFYPDAWARYEGSAAQLMAEGLIPEGLAWPQAAKSVDWMDGCLKYRLCRSRPAGHKGPMKSWLALDHWSLTVCVTGRDWTWSARGRLERAAQALRDEIYAQSPAGQREWQANWNRWWAAHKDPAFQAFKAGVLPARKKPGRQGGAEAMDRLQGRVGGLEGEQ